MRKKFVFILASVLLLCLLYFSFHLISKISLKRKHQSNVERLLSEADMKSGDLIFRKGRSLRSRVVLVVDQECDYSHVGLVYLTDDNTYVIHAVPGETEGKVNYVKKEKIEDFLSFQKAKKTVIYRLKGNETDRVASKSAERALKYVVEKRIFDDNYDLNSDDEVYCTELVWKVYLNEGVDLTQGTFDFLGIPLRSGDYILPGKFINSSLLKKIYEF